MKKSRINLFISIMVVYSGTNALASVSAIEIMNKNFLVSKVKDSKSDSIMKLIDSNGNERIREMSTVTKLKENSTDTMRLVTFLSPTDIKGTKSLLIENSKGDDGIWIYLPALKKVRRLVASNKKDSFVGSDFSYGDMVGYKVDNWKHKLLREEPCGTQKCYVIESIPKSASEIEETGYSKYIGWYDKENSFRSKAEVYDQGGQLLKTITADKITQVDKTTNKWFAYYIESKNTQTGRKTIIQVKNYKANVKVSSSLFTAGNLESR